MVSELLHQARHWKSDVSADAFEADQSQAAATVFAVKLRNTIGLWRKDPKPSFCGCGPWLVADVARSDHI